MQEKTVKKREYKREWAERPLYPTITGVKEKLAKSCGTTIPAVRRALSGKVLTELAYTIRKRAYEDYGFGFIS